jgi:hypothetical protein
LNIAKLWDPLKRMSCALIGVVVFRAFVEAQAVGLVMSALDLATKSTHAPEDSLANRGLCVNKIATRVASTHKSAIKIKTKNGI